MWLLLDKIDFYPSYINSIAMDSKEELRVGFFPAFFNLGETQRLVRIAKCFEELGGEAVFFSHGGEYERLAEEAGFEVIRVEPIYSEEEVERLWELECSQSILRLMLEEPSTKYYWESDVASS